jgi:hypothetical protein
VSSEATRIEVIFDGALFQRRNFYPAVAGLR